MANSHQHQLAESSMDPERLYNCEGENSSSCRENDPWSSNLQSETLVNELAGLPVVVVAAIIIEFNSIHVYLMRPVNSLMATNNKRQ
jgi:hypothetical protein